MEAIEDLDVAIELDSSMAFAYNNKAFALLKQSQTNAALNYVNTSLRLNNQNPYAFKTRGEIYLLLHQKDKACSDFTNAESLNKEENLRKEILALRRKACKN